MADTLVLTRVMSGTTRTVLYLTYSSDGTGTTGYTFYSASTQATLAKITNTLQSRIIQLDYTTNCASGNRMYLQWKGTTNQLALSIPNNHSGSLSFDSYGGLLNIISLANGRTGDILFTSSGSTNGDNATLVLTVENK